MTQTVETDPTAPNAHRFEPLEPGAADRWSTFLDWEQTFFPNVVGIVMEEVRRDYSRLRLVYRDELNQPAGIVHGGAIATLIDTVVVPAVAGPYGERPMLATISMNINYLAPVIAQDAVAEGWIEKRGRSTVFCRAEVRTSTGELCATASLVYKVRSTPMPEPR